MNKVKKTGVFISTPVRYWKGVDKFIEEHPHCRSTLEGLEALSADPSCPYEFYWCVAQGGLVRARNKSVQSFLKTGCKWMITWDDDIVATPEDFLRLLSHQQPIVAGLYTTREEVGSHWTTNFLFEVTAQGDGLIQVFECSTGFKLFHRQVFTELQRLCTGSVPGLPSISYTDRDTGEKLYGYFQQVVLDGDALTEDYFCDFLCRRAKIALWVDTKLKLKQVGPNGELYPKEWPPIPGIEK